jgi:hypothetical protein
MNETRLTSQVACLELVTSFLLAREAVHSGKSMELMHEPFVNEIIGITRNLHEIDPQGQTAAALEADMTATLDRLFLMAHHMRQQMHD